ncbi:SpoIIE family protein phosphatase [Streptomyces similanensis]|uniref:PAS domain-containing protein n=1 Tax=Streptomyces similanensis TaxID=1274988 RepID=A0ABP9K1L6_9ACTN|nr:SpoIIE family protein phosphatase [Streptomyces seoulensis]
MPSPLSADPSSALPSGRGAVDALITQARRLKGEVVAVRREAPGDTADPQGRWERALCDLALHQLADLDAHLAQLRDGPPLSPAAAAPDGPGADAAPEPSGAPHGSLLSRVGSAEWNLLTDEAGWSAELYRILGLDPAGPARTLDELPSLVLDEDRPLLTALVTDCLVDARPVEGEFRVVRPDGAVRTVHLMGEPVLDADGATAAMWAVLRDVSELRRSQSAVRETRDSLHRDRRPAHDGHRLAVEPEEVALPPWRGFPRLPHPGGPALDLAAAPGGPVAGGWCDALELSDGTTVLTAGALADPGPGGAADPAMPLGALRGMALAGADPARQLACLGQLLTAAPGPSLAGAVCCRYRPDPRTLEWARAGGPAPLLFRAGTGRVLDAPQSAPPGAGQAGTALGVGDVLVLRTGRPASGHDEADTVRRLLALAPRLGSARSARDCLRVVLAEFGGSGHADGLDVLVARVLP